MGQQAAKALAPCVSRQKLDPQAERDQLQSNLKRVEDLLADPATLKQECDCHFRRAGSNAHGEMRRVELRRLLYTFAHSLGSTELTWEAIEANAVIGTLDSQTPVVTREEFFRCVTKTVHLVAAELRRNLQEVEARLSRPRPKALLAASPPQRPPLPVACEQRLPLPKEDHGRGGQEEPCEGRKPVSPWAALAQMQNKEGAFPEASSYTSSEGEEQVFEDDEEAAQPQSLFRPSPFIGDRDRSQETEVEAAAVVPSGGRGAVFRPSLEKAPAAAPSGGYGAVFRPSPKKEEDDQEEGLIALVLSSEGSFDAHRFAVGTGMLSLSRLGKEGEIDASTAYDLSLLELAVAGEAVLDTPAALLVPSFARTPESIQRLLVLGFDGGAVLCMWFQALEGSARCLAQVLAEAEAYGAEPFQQGLLEH